MPASTTRVPLAAGTARTRAGAVCWLLTLWYFVAQPIVAAAWPHPYSYLHNYLSDLGATRCGVRGVGSPFEVCSPWHDLMNGSFLVVGLLVAAGAVLLRPIWPRRRTVTAGMILMVVAGLGLCVVGLSPEDVSLAVHGLAAALHIPAQGVALLLLGLGTLRRSRPIAVWTLVCAVVALLGTVLFFAHLYGPLGRGGMERLALYPFMIWVPVTAVVHLVRARTRAPARADSSPATTAPGS